MASRRARFTRGWWFVLPGLTLMILVVGTPLLLSLRYSLHRVFLYDFDNQSFVGLKNYVEAFSDPLFINALKTTTIFTVGCVLLSVTLGLLIAFLLNARQVKLRPMWLALFLIPFVMTPVVGGIAWRLFMWQQEFGVVNQIAAVFGVEPR